MAPALHRRAAPLHPDGGWSPSAPLRTWSPGPRRRRAAPTYGRRPRYGPDAAGEPPRKQRQQHGRRGPWLQPPRGPRRAVHAPRRCWRCRCRWGGPWRPPPRAGCWQPCGRAHAIQVCGLHPLYLCCCSCWPGPCSPGWTGPPCRKRRWGRRGRGPRRPPRRATPRADPSSPPPPPEGLHEWRAPGLRAPRNTTQFIMDQVYEDLREQQELERRRQGVLRAPRARAAGPAPGSDAGPGGGPEGAELPAFLFGCVQSGASGFSPVPGAPSQQLKEEEDRNDECEQEECDGKDAEEEEEAQEEEEGEVEAEEEAEVEAEGEEEVEEEEAGLGEDELKEEENELPVQIPLSFLVEAEEEGEDFELFFQRPSDNS